MESGEWRVEWTVDLKCSGVRETERAEWREKWRGTRRSGAWSVETGAWRVEKKVKWFGELESGVENCRSLGTEVWRLECGDWKRESGEWTVESAVASGEWRVDWRLESKEWSTGWRMERGGWSVESGEESEVQSGEVECGIQWRVKSRMWHEDKSGLEGGQWQVECAECRVELRAERVEGWSGDWRVDGVDGGEQRARSGEWGVALRVESGVFRHVFCESFLRGRLDLRELRVTCLHSGSWLL